MFSFAETLWFAVNATDVYFFGDELLAYPQIQVFFFLPNPRFHSSSLQLNHQSLAALFLLLNARLWESAWIAFFFFLRIRNVLWAINTNAVIFFIFSPSGGQHT